MLARAANGWLARVGARRYGTRPWRRRERLLTGRFRIVPSPCTRGTSMRSGSTRAALRSWASPRTARPLPAAASTETRAADRRGCFERLRAWRMLPGCVPVCRAMRSRVPIGGTSRPVSPKASRASVTWRSARCLVWTTCTKTCTKSSSRRASCPCASTCSRRTWAISKGSSLCRLDSRETSCVPRGPSSSLMACRALTPHGCTSPT